MIGFLVLFAFSAFVIAGTFLINDIFDGLPDKENKVRSFSKLFSMLIILYTTVVFAGDNTFKSDLNSGWNNYSYAPPLSACECA